MELINGNAAHADTTFQHDVATMVVEMVNWEIDLDHSVGGATRLVGDLGFQSLDIVMLILAIEGRYQRQDLPFDEVLMVDGEYVTDLTVAEVADFLTVHVGGTPR
jgi:acyl carrier protein